MEVPINQRLRVFVDYLRSQGLVYNDSDFSRRLTKNRSQISELINGKRSVTRAFAVDVQSVFPELNIDWLVEEECDQMLKGGVVVTGDGNHINNGRDQVVGNSKDMKLLLDTIQKQQAQIDRLLNIIEKMQG